MREQNREQRATSRTVGRTRRASGSRGDKQQIDMQELAQRVYARLVRELRIERERLGKR